MIIDPNILIGALAVICLALVADIFHLRWTLRKVFRNEKCGDLGGSIISMDGDVKKLQKFQGDMESYLRNIERRIRRSAQVVETVRFNAFKDGGTGGYQSFATAILNEDGDGAVFSSLYARDRVSVFSKPVAKFASEIELSEEESRVVAMAKAKLAART